MMATKDYITRESTLLSFKRGDIIKLMDADLDDGMLLYPYQNYFYMMHQIFNPSFGILVILNTICSINLQKCSLKAASLTQYM